MRSILFILGLFCTTLYGKQLQFEIPEKLKPLLQHRNGKVSAEVISTGHIWSEGPVWINSHNMLLFTDPPKNKIFAWTEAKSVWVWKDNAGFDDTKAPISDNRGANGLILNHQGELLACLHGKGQVVNFGVPTLQSPRQIKILASKWNGKRFNSPNDLSIAVNGDIYFTDPPYYFKGKLDHPKKPQAYSGIYKISNNNEISLVSKHYDYPNGVHLSSDNQSLIVLTSNTEKPLIVSHKITAAGIEENGKVLLKGNDLAKKIFFDGLDINADGIIFAAAGKYGVVVLKESGEYLGQIKVGMSSNVVLGGPKNKTLFITNNDRVLKVELAPSNLEG